ncbi:MAG: hypothetical protein ACI8QC_001259 [Planctomycetota bacterium]|jgi:uncharacterized protein YprB with RNaseH-like and TPR domain
MTTESRRERLRRLRRDPSPEPEVQPESESPSKPKAMPGWLKARLGRQAGAPSSAAPEQPVEQQPSWPVGSGEPQNLVLAEGPRGPYWARTELFQGADLHGNWRLDAVDGIDTGIFPWLTGDGGLAGLDARQAIYLDTETTGLSGGAGTWVFMVGLGRFLPDGSFELWQGFMRGPEDEPALLAEASRRIAEAGSLVSFFGKSFDRHRLEDKMRLCGVAPPFENKPHLDLYHPLRRLFGGSFDDGRLATLERELCGLQRDNDLPGSQAPAAWFDYLAERPHRLEGVFHHNRLDVLSLVTLLAWLGRAGGELGPDGNALSGPAGARRRGVLSSCAGAKDLPAALELAERALQLEPGARDLGLARAELLRRLRQDEAAGVAFAELASGPEDDFTAPIHAAWAKFLEHRAKNYSAALAACLRAEALLEAYPPGAGRGRLARDLEGRALRLRRKAGCPS